jgi:hypothetical protein
MEETPLTYLTKKELCVEIVRSETLPDGTITFKGNLSKKMLINIIHTAGELLNNYRLFTLDFKPSNMGLLKGRIVIIDFDPEWSYLLNDDCDINEYISVIILIILVHSYIFSCYDPQLLTHDDLRDLARIYISNQNYTRLISDDYKVEDDPCLNLSFNRSIAPSFTQFKSPLEVLNHYTRFANLKEIIKDLFDS